MQARQAEAEAERAERIGRLEARAAKGGAKADETTPRWQTIAGPAWTRPGGGLLVRELTIGSHGN